MVLVCVPVSYPILANTRGQRCLGLIEVAGARTEKIYALALYQRYSLSPFTVFDSLLSIHFSRHEFVACLTGKDVIFSRGKLPRDITYWVASSLKTTFFVGIFPEVCHKFLHKTVPSKHRNCS